MTVDNKLELMQIALEIFKIEAKNRGNYHSSFINIYNNLEDKVKEVRESKPTASEYFNTKKE